MATGGRKDSTDNGAALPVDEEQVSQQTEAIFLSYAFHTTQLRTEDEDSRPLGGEIEDARQRDGNIDKVGQKLALIGDDLNKRYAEEFDNMLTNLNPNLENSYEYFKKIASSVFETGMNWGRVLTLLGFGYRMAVYIWKNGQRGFLRTIAQWLARYLVESSIARWISRQGGWAAVLKLTDDSVKKVLMALGVVLILQFVIKRLS